MSRRLDANDERGVSLIITALALVAIFAMVVLVIDAGALLVKRRALVKAADAAALAAAQSCVSETGDEETQADTFAALNATGTSGGITDDCGGKWVTVKYTAQQQLPAGTVADDLSARGWRVEALEADLSDPDNIPRIRDVETMLHSELVVV